MQGNRWDFMLFYGYIILMTEDGINPSVRDCVGTAIKVNVSRRRVLARFIFNAEAKTTEMRRGLKIWREQSAFKSLHPDRH